MIRSVLLACVLSLLLPVSASADVVRGRITDPDGRPVSSARVLIARGGVVVASAITTRDGQYGPLTLPAGQYEVIVATPGLRAAPRAIDVAATGAMDVDIALALAAVNEAVVVAAAQVDRPLSRVTDNVTAVDRTELEARQTETATDVLRLVPGFSVSSSGGYGALSSIFPRGGESDYTLVVIDGIPQNSFGGGFDAGHLGVAGIDRIDIVRGPQSALFGSGAIGGILNLTTINGGPSRGRAIVEGGGLGYSRVLADAAGSHNAWTWGAAIERDLADGDTSFRDSIGRNVANDDYERMAGSVSAGWSDRATRQVRVDARFTRDERGFPGPYGSDPLGLYSGLDEVSRGINRTRSISGAATLGDPQRLRHRLFAGWSSAPSRFISPFGESEDRTRRVTARYQADVERTRAGFSGGVEFLREQADNTFITGEVFQPVPVRRSTAGLFGEVRSDIGGRGAVTAGLRLERIAREALEANPSEFGPRPPFATDVVWSLNPKVSAAWFLRGARSMDATTGWTKVRLGAGTGIKAPTAFEIAFTDNPSLKPERSRSVDAGIEHVFAGALFAVDATVFANRYDDLIVAVRSSFGGASPYSTDNIANARSAGVELGARWIHGSGLFARAAYTFLDTEVLDVDNAPGQAPAPFTVGDPLIRRPRHQGSLELRYARGRANAFLLVTGRGRILDLEPNFASQSFTNGGHVVVSLGGAWRLHRAFEVYARVTNLFDRAYEDVLGFPAPGATATAGLRVAVGR